MFIRAWSLSTRISSATNSRSQVSPGESATSKLLR